jgi:hypothetical protein
MNSMLSSVINFGCPVGNSNRRVINNNNIYNNSANNNNNKEAAYRSKSGEKVIG